MTPKRKKYLKRCSEREKYIREEIQIYKKSVKHWKHYLNVELPKILAKGEKPSLYDTPEEARQAITHQTFQMKTYRHELNSLKSMDRVVVPKVKFSVPQIREWGRTGRKSYYATCKCENDNLYSGSDERYCPKCGRHILWEKVK